MNKTKGQSLVELLIAMAVFVLAVSAIAFLIIDSYISNRLGREKTQATFLAEEGLEATRAIRDNNWENLTDGQHGLAISDGKWIFSGSQEDISNQLRVGIRKIIVESIAPDRKKVTSQILWNLTEGRSQDTILVTYLTNWAKTTIFDCSSYCRMLGYGSGLCVKNVKKCSQIGGTYRGGGDQYCLPPNNTCCCLF